MKVFFRGWSKSQKVALYRASGLISAYCLLKLKQYVYQRRLRRQGFRRCDLSSQLFGITQEMGSSPTVSGFEVCSDSLTADHLKAMSRVLMRSLINFRSQIHKIDGEWYYKELADFHPETHSMDEYVTTVSLTLDDDDEDDSSSSIDDDANINEKILQRSLQWLNEHRAFNVKWDEYDRAHFDMIYFHFQSLGKCVFYFRFDHMLGDGILISSLVALIQNHLYSPSQSTQSMDWTNIEDIAHLIDSVRGNMFKSRVSSKLLCWTWWMMQMYRWIHYPVAWIEFIRSNIKLALNPTPKCVYFGESQDSHRMALGRPISVSTFKSVAHFNGGTVNDLFMAISIGSLRRYALKMKCPVFESNAYNGDISKLGIASHRPLDTNNFAKEIKQFAEDGTNANKLDLVPFFVNVKNVDVEKVQRAFRGIKYGASRPVMRTVFQCLGSIPGGRRAQCEAGRDFTLATSNVQGPTRPIPIPNGAVPIFFGMANSGFLPINYTLVSYNHYLRVGLSTNNGSIQDPEALMQCFVEEWHEYKDKSKD